MSNPAPTKEIEAILEMFYRDYDKDLMPILTSHASGGITIEEQVRQSEIIWKKHIKKATDQFIRLVQQERKAGYGEGVVAYAKAHKETLDKMDDQTYHAGPTKIIKAG